MNPARIVYLFIGLTGLIISLLTLFGIDLALVFGVLDPGVGFHTRDPGGRLGFGIVGGLMVGWAITCDGLAHGHPPTQTMRRGAVAWFVLDSSVSVASGMWPNALFNLAFLVPLVTVGATARGPFTQQAG